MGNILIFYKYITIEAPELLMDEQRSVCEKLELKGRILIAREGINATVGGTREATEQYKEYLRQHALFHDADIKESEGCADHFPRLQVKIKKSLINFGDMPELNVAQNAGKRLDPHEVHALLQNRPNDLVVLDARNNYESRIGVFENALTPDINHFRDLPQYIDEHVDQFKDKTVLMYCTAGIRCEPATAYLKLKNVAKEVLHIKGGIHRYVEQYPDGFFKGKNYVFDGRVSQAVTDDILACCELCKKPYDEYSNCINAECNKQIIVCTDCIGIYHNTCSQVCSELVKNSQVNVRTIPHKILIPAQNRQTRTQ